MKWSDIPVGSMVLRVGKDNYPDCRVGDIGFVVADDDYTKKYFGHDYREQGMVLCKFHDQKPSPNLIKHLEVLEA